MKILYILNDGPAKLSDKIIHSQSKNNKVKVIDLIKKFVSYEDIVDRIFFHDRVISW